MGKLKRLCVGMLVMATYNISYAQEPGEGGIVGTGRTLDDPNTRFERPDFPDRVERFEPEIPEVKSLPIFSSDMTGGGSGGGASGANVPPPPQPGTH